MKKQCRKFGRGIDSKKRNQLKDMGASGFTFVLRREKKGEV
jgi:hypothetical protein